MGGEQWPILVYGSKQSYTLIEWMERLELIDKKKWVKNFLENEEHTYEDDYDTDDEDGIEVVFDQEYMEYTEEMITTLMNLLSDYNLTVVYFSNFCWEEFGIGLEVAEYENTSSEDKERVQLFCDRYKLGKPTWYAGIVGELE